MKLLLAQDDFILADVLSGQLRRSGFEVEHVPNGAVAEYLLHKQRFDVAILDLGLPMVDVLKILQRLRTARQSQPVLLLTARDSLDERVAGLNAGADDYLTKPFAYPELHARLRALARRARTSAFVTEMGHLGFDRNLRRATLKGMSINLSPLEWTLLDILLSQRDKVVTKAQICQAWMNERNELTSIPRATDVHIHRLRRKLEGSGLAIRTVRGLGYLLEPSANVDSVTQS